MKSCAPGLMKVANSLSGGKMSQGNSMGNMMVGKTKKKNAKLKFKKG